VRNTEVALEFRQSRDVSDSDVRPGNECGRQIIDLVNRPRTQVSIEHCNRRPVEALAPLSTDTKRPWHHSAGGLGTLECSCTFSPGHCTPAAEGSARRSLLERYR
jgi:hypothetical protein